MYLFWENLVSCCITRCLSSSRRTCSIFSLNSRECFLMEPCPAARPLSPLVTLWPLGVGVVMSVRGADDTTRVGRVPLPLRSRTTVEWVAFLDDVTLHHVSNCCMRLYIVQTEECFKKINCIAPSQGPFSGFWTTKALELKLKITIIMQLSTSHALHLHYMCIHLPDV